MLLKPGTRVKVEVYISDTPVVLHTSVRSCDSQTIELDAPVVQGKKVGVPPDTKVTMTETSSGGLLLVETEVVQVRTKPIPVWELRVPSINAIRKIQRRIEERYEVDLHLRWKRRDDFGWPESALLHMINVNASGALVSAPVELQVGDEIIIDLTPLIRVGGDPNVGHRISPRCKIVRRTSKNGQCYGLTFENLDRMEKIHLSEAIRRLKSRVV